MTLDDFWTAHPLDFELAGEGLPAVAIALNAPRLYDRMRHNSTALCIAAAVWPDDAFSAWESRLLTPLSTAAGAAYAARAGRIWPKARYAKHETCLVDLALSYASTAFWVGDTWPEAQYAPYAQRLVRAVSTSPNWRRRAIQYWPDARLTPLLERLTGSAPAPALRTHLSRTQVTTWADIAQHVPAASLDRIPYPHFPAVAQAYTFSSQTGHEEDFYAGLSASIEAGTVEAWAQHICDAFSHPDEHSTLERAVGGAP